MAEHCQIGGCDAVAVSHGLCDKHRKRLERRGTLVESDWGKRTTHPLYTLWNARSKRGALCAAWANDFWEFVKGVGERPSESAHLRALDTTKAVGPQNFYWQIRSADPDGRAYSKEWRLRNPDKVKGYVLKRCYGIELEEYQERRKAQRGICAICKNKTSNLHVDHDHKTGKIRELLCGPCNQGLGNFKDSTELLEVACAYLKKHSA